jgi:hypothetical protein
MFDIAAPPVIPAFRSRARARARARPKHISRQDAKEYYLAPLQLGAWILFVRIHF